MAVIVIADVQGQTDDGLDGMLERLKPALLEADGFIAHGAWPARGDDWLTFEIWENAADATSFFATHVRPHLPAGAAPKRTLVELHALMLGQLPTLLREHARDVPTALGAGYR